MFTKNPKLPWRFQPRNPNDSSFLMRDHMAALFASVASMRFRFTLDAFGVRWLTPRNRRSRLPKLRERTIATMPWDDFVSYLAGLIKADGSFKVWGLTIDLDLRDFGLAVAIVTRLGLSPHTHIQDRRVSKSPANAANRYRITIAIGEIGPLLTDLNGRFVFHARVDQLRKHWDAYSRVLPPGSLPLPNSDRNFFGWWITGFFDGDGSVSTDTTEEDAIAAGRRSRFGMVISVTQSGPTNILELYARRFGMTVGTNGRQKPGCKPEWKARTRGTAQLRDLFDHFTDYPSQGVKRSRLEIARGLFAIFLFFYGVVITWALSIFRGGTRFGVVER